jgi:hypothetical protein
VSNVGSGTNIELFLFALHAAFAIRSRFRWPLVTDVKLDIEVCEEKFFPLYNIPFVCCRCNLHRCPLSVKHKRI